MLLPNFLNITLFLGLFIGFFFWLYVQKKVPEYMLIGGVFIIILGVFFVQNQFLFESGTQTNQTAVSYLNTTNTTITQTVTMTPASFGYITNVRFGLYVILLGIFFILISVLERFGVLK